MSEEPYEPKKIPARALSAFCVGLNQRHGPDFKCTCEIEFNKHTDYALDFNKHTNYTVVIKKCPLCEAAPDLARYAYALTQRQDLKPDTFDIIMDMMKAHIERLEEAIKEV